MRILLIADIHANRLALEAVLEAFADADEVWCLGDIVSFGPCPAECIDLVRSRCTRVIRGNHDCLGCVGEFDLSLSDIDYMEHLPERLSVRTDGLSYLLIHTPPQCEGYVAPGAGHDFYGRLAQELSEDVMLFGHSHIAAVVEAGGKRFVNAGTVGQPRDGDPRAQCMILEDGRVSFRRVAYDLDALAADYRRSPLPPDTQETWLGWSRAGIVDVHGLQLGPFSATRKENEDEQGPV